MASKHILQKIAARYGFELWNYAAGPKSYWYIFDPKSTESEIVSANLHSITYEYFELQCRELLRKLDNR